MLADGRYGVLVPARDEKSLAVGLRRLLDPAERSRFAGRGQAAVLERYDVTRLVADVEALYDELLGDRSEGVPTTTGTVSQGA